MGLAESHLVNQTLIERRGTHFNAQRSDNELLSALRKEILWLTFGADVNLIRRWNPLRPLAHWYYNRRMNRYISRELESRFADHQKVAEAEGVKRRKSKTIIDLALDKYLEEQKSPNVTKCMDANFKRFAISQMKVFILAGHDTTSSTLCYIFYLLSITPSALERVRAEHDKTFGIDYGRVQSIIISNPHILNQLPYTLAVIKETMRLFPAGSTTRQGDPGFSLTEDGHQYPTEDCIVWSLHQLIHREPLYWPQPDTFLPERWLVSNDDPLYPVKGAYRPFEFGPRNCIGQELAMLEIKLVMAMTIREFDITTAFQEFEQVNGIKGPCTVNGEIAYQSLDGTNRPRDGFPCRITAAVR